MEDRLPLLIFQQIGIADRTKLRSGGSGLHFPPRDRQVRRLSPLFDKLRDTFENRRVHLTSNPEGLDPEEVLVLDIAGNVDDFFKAVEKVDGLEWMGEIANDNLLPDEDFYEDGHLDKSFSGKLYLTASNATAINQLVSLWEHFSSDESFTFPRGQAKLKHVFEQLRTIRFWDASDRLLQEDAEFWIQCIEQNPEVPVRIEIELWFRSNASKRRIAEESVAHLIGNAGGSVLSSCELPEIRYHSILAEVPGGQMRTILNNIEYAELIQNNNIMIFRPTGQEISSEISIDSSFESDFSEIVLNDHNPRIAVFDGLPLSNHEALKDSVIIDDPDNFESYYSVDNRQHGTQMCSLILRGDLNSCNDAISSPIYIRPIMKPGPNGKEWIPDDVLAVDLIHRAVKRMMEGENGEPPTASRVKVINFSIGDTRRVFFRTMSPMARLLDWLSFKYNILFIISAGNSSIPLVVDSEAEFRGLSTHDKGKYVFNNILSHRGDARLTAPSESINNLTIGAVHADLSSLTPYDRRLNPYDLIMPAIYSRIGGGYRKSIKPDLVFPGGRQMYNEVIASNVPVHPSSQNSQPGVQVAVPDSSRNKTSYSRGTSHATALITHCASKCLEVIEGLNIPNDSHAVLLKAMLAHGCSWDGIEDNIKSCIDNLSTNEVKRIVTQFIGYGIPNIELALGCNSSRATAVACDEIPIGAAHIYKFPLPPSLSANTTFRRLTITLAWLTPIYSSSQKYRQTKLWFDSPDAMAGNRHGPDWQKVRNGTLQHEVFDGNSAEVFTDGDCITIKINCSEDASKSTERIRYALVVSLDAKSATNLPIYHEVAERINVRVPIAQ